MSQPADENIEKKVVHFVDGIPGFPTLERFIVVELRDDGAFQELQSIDDPDFSMIVSSETRPVKADG